MQNDATAEKSKWERIMSRLLGCETTEISREIVYCQARQPADILVRGSLTTWRRAIGPNGQQLSGARRTLFYLFNVWLVWERKNAPMGRIAPSIGRRISAPWERTHCNHIWTMRLIVRDCGRCTKCYIRIYFLHYIASRMHVCANAWIGAKRQPHCKWNMLTLVSFNVAGNLFATAFSNLSI